MTPTQSEFAEAGPTRPWPAERIEYWAIERLIPYANNARLHSEGDIDKLAAAIRKWGWTNPVLVDEEKSAPTAWPTINWRRGRNGIPICCATNSRSSGLPISTLA